MNQEGGGPWEYVRELRTTHPKSANALALVLNAFEMIAKVFNWMNILLVFVAVLPGISLLLLNHIGRRGREGWSDSIVESSVQELSILISILFWASCAIISWKLGI